MNKKALRLFKKISAYAKTRAGRKAIREAQAQAEADIERLIEARQVKPGDLMREFDI
jgi:hypothetical protein